MLHQYTTYVIHHRRYNVALGKRDITSSGGVQMKNALRIEADRILQTVTNALKKTDMVLPTCFGFSETKNFIIGMPMLGSQEDKKQTRDALFSLVEKEKMTHYILTFDSYINICKDKTKIPETGLKDLPGTKEAIIAVACSPLKSFVLVQVYTKKGTQIVFDLKVEELDMDGSNGYTMWNYWEKKVLH